MKNAISQLLSIILALLLCVGLLAAFSQMTNGFTEDFKTFYVSYNGEDIFTQESKMCFAPGEHTFDVTYTFEFLDEDDKINTDFSVKIVPNVEKETDFTFTVDGNQYAYSSVTDLTVGFDIVKNEGSFTLIIQSGTSVKSVLEAVYEKSVDVQIDESSQNFELYTLVISSYDERVTYKIDFSIAEWIKLDKTQIVF